MKPLVCGADAGLHVGMRERGCVGEPLFSEVSVGDVRE